MDQAMGRKAARAGGAESLGGILIPRALKRTVLWEVGGRRRRYRTDELLIEAASVIREALRDVQRMKQCNTLSLTPSYCVCNAMLFVYGYDQYITAFPFVCLPGPVCSRRGFYPGHCARTSRIIATVMRSRPVRLQSRFFVVFARMRRDSASSPCYNNSHFKIRG